MTVNKLSGLGGAVTCTDASSSAQTITDDITNWTLSTPRATQDVTGVGKSANERLLLLADVSITLNGTFDDGTDMSHEVFSTVSSTSVQRTVVLTPTTDDPYISVNVLATDYQLTRAATGELTFQVPMSLADGTVPTWQT
jgi:hypothetical protein